MLRFRLHPTPTGWFAGLAVIALWALLWLWFLVSLAAGPGEARARAFRAPPIASAGDMMRSRPET